MRTENIDVKFTMSFPVDKPDRNNVIYTKDCVFNAFKQSLKDIPIVFRGNNIKDGCTPIGIVNDSKLIEYDEKNQVAKIEIDGKIRFGGTECIVDIENNIVNSMKITGLGISN